MIIRVADPFNKPNIQHSTEYLPVQAKEPWKSAAVLYPYQQ